VAVHKDLIGEDVNAFLFDRQARGLSGGSVRFYRQKLALVRQFCTAQGIASVTELDSAAIRQLLVELQRAHTPGGVHAVNRALRAFLLWWQDEEAPVGWSNPMRKVRAPRVGIEPLEPIVPTDHSPRGRRATGRPAPAGRRAQARLSSLILVASSPALAARIPLLGL
jgi:site-specific recombinase XerC